MGSGWAVVIKSQLKGCRGVCYRDTSNSLHTDGSAWSPSLVIPVWFGSPLLQRIVPNAALLVMQHCAVGVKSKWIKSQALCSRSFFFNRFFHCDSSDPILILDIFLICRDLYSAGFCYRFYFWGKQLKHWVQMTLTGHKSPGMSAPALTLPSLSHLLPIASSRVINPGLRDPHCQIVCFCCRSSICWLITCISTLSAFDLTLLRAHCFDAEIAWPSVCLLGIKVEFSHTCVALGSVSPTLTRYLYQPWKFVNKALPIESEEVHSETSWHISKTFKLSWKLSQKISSPLWLSVREMSSLNELEKFSDRKHLIFQRPLDIFQTPTARLIPQQALWGASLGLHPKPLYTCKYWGWFLLEEGTNLTLVRYAWAEEKNCSGTHGERKRLWRKRKIRQQLREHKCVLRLTFTVFEKQFPFWKD